MNVQGFPHLRGIKIAICWLSSRFPSQVFGMVWQEEDYTAYDRWLNTEDQIKEVLAFNVTGVEKCSRSSDSVAVAGGAYRIDAP